MTQPHPESVNAGLVEDFAKFRNSAYAAQDRLLAENAGLVDALRQADEVLRAVYVRTGDTEAARAHDAAFEALLKAERLEGGPRSTPNPPHPQPEGINTGLVEALTDMREGWRYIREHHGDLYGVGWDRAQDKADAAIAKAQAHTESMKMLVDTDWLTRHVEADPDADTEAQAHTEPGKAGEWVTVPREPTEAMVAAGVDQTIDQYDANRDWDDAKDVVEKLDQSALYRAMLNASPPPPVGETL